MKAFIREVSRSSRAGGQHLILTVEVAAPAFKVIDGKDIDLDYSDIEALSIRDPETHRHPVIDLNLPEPKVRVTDPKHDVAKVAELSKPPAPQVAK